MRLYQICLSIVIVIVACIFLYPSSTKADNAWMTPCETWVLSQIRSGKQADLALYNPVDLTDSGLVLTAKFIEMVLKGNYSVVGDSTEYPHHSIRIKNASVTTAIDLSYDTIPRATQFEDCVFHECVLANSTCWLSDVAFLNCRFIGPIDFKQMEVIGSLYFNGSTFCSHVNLLRAYIKNALLADYVKFLDTVVINFDDIRVGAQLGFFKTQFNGPLNMTLANVGGNIQIGDAMFSHKSGINRFYFMKVGGNLYSMECQFKGPVNFGRSEISGALYLQSSIFEKWVDFHFTNVKLALMASETKFLDTSIVHFENMSIGGQLNIFKTEFNGPIRMLFADIGSNLEADSAKFNYDSLSDEINSFTNTNFGGTVFLRGCLFKGPIGFLHCRAGGSFHLAGASFLFDGPIDDSLGNRIRALTIDRSDIAGQLNVRGLNISEGNYILRRVTYSELLAGPVDHASDVERANKYKLDFIEKSEFNIDSYLNLERYFNDRGLPKWADRTYIKLRQRERSETLTVWSLSWWGNLILDYTVDYGRSPGRVLILSGIIVLSGGLFFLFTWKQAITSTNRKTFSSIEPFWFALDVYLPVIGLYAADKWEPSTCSKLELWIVRLLRLSGWSFLPIGLAAITGLIS